MVELTIVAHPLSHLVEEGRQGQEHSCGPQPTAKGQTPRAKDVAQTMHCAAAGEYPDVRGLSPLGLLQFRGRFHGGRTGKGLLTRYRVSKEWQRLFCRASGGLRLDSGVLARNRKKRKGEKGRSQDGEVKVLAW